MTEFVGLCRALVGNISEADVIGERRSVPWASAMMARGHDARHNFSRRICKVARKRVAEIMSPQVFQHPKMRRSLNLLRFKQIWTDFVTPTSLLRNYRLRVAASASSIASYEFWPCGLQMTTLALDR